MIRCFRLNRDCYDPRSGKGASRYGGRWNPVGSEAIYAAASVSLAVLEILVHHTDLPENYVLTEITIPDRVSRKELSLDQLPKHWDSQSPIPATQIIGQKWIQHAGSAVLIVPSSVVPADRNYVLNPKHPDFAKIRFATPAPFRFDPRLR